MITMSQRDVIDYLKRYPDTWVTRDEIIRNMNLSLSSANYTIKALVKAGEIERRYERVEDLDKPGYKRVVTWIKLSNSYKLRLMKEGLL